MISDDSKYNLQNQLFQGINFITAFLEKGIFGLRKAQQITLTVSGIFFAINFGFACIAGKRWIARQGIGEKTRVGLVISTCFSAITLGYFLSRTLRNNHLNRQRIDLDKKNGCADLDNLTYQQFKESHDIDTIEFLTDEAKESLKIKAQDWVKNELKNECVPDFIFEEELFGMDLKSFVHKLLRENKSANELTLEFVEQYPILFEKKIVNPSDAIDDELTLRQELMNEIRLQNKTLTQIPEVLFKSGILDSEDECFQTQLIDFVCTHLQSYLKDYWEDVEDEIKAFKIFIDECDCLKGKLGNKIERLRTDYADVKDLEETSKKLAEIETTINEYQIKIDTSLKGIENLKKEYSLCKEAGKRLEQKCELLLYKRIKLQEELGKTLDQKIGCINKKISNFREAILMAFDDRDSPPESAINDDSKIKLKEVESILKQQEEALGAIRKNSLDYLSHSVVLKKQLMERLLKVENKLNSLIREQEIVHLGLESEIDQLKKLIESKIRIIALETEKKIAEDRIKELEEQIGKGNRVGFNPLSLIYPNDNSDEKENLIKKCSDLTLQLENEINKEIHNFRYNEELEKNLKDIQLKIEDLRTQRKEILPQLNFNPLKSEILKINEISKQIEFEFKNYKQIFKNNEEEEKQLETETQSLDEKILTLQQDLKLCDDEILKILVEQENHKVKVRTCFYELEKLYGIHTENLTSFVNCRSLKIDLENKIIDLLNKHGLESPITMTEFFEGAGEYIRGKEDESVSDQ